MFPNFCIRVDDECSVVLLGTSFSLQLLLSFVFLFPLVEDLPLLAERSSDVQHFVWRLGDVQAFGFGPSVTVPVSPVPCALLWPLTGPALAGHPVPAPARASVISAPCFLVTQVNQGLSFRRLGDGDGDRHGRLGERHPHRHGRLGQVSRAGFRGEGGLVVGGGGSLDGVLCRTAEQLLSARHLATFAQLVGPLLPHRHVDLPPPLAAVGEGVGAIEGLLVCSSGPTVRLFREVRSAPVDSSFSVQVGSSPSTKGQNEFIIKMGMQCCQIVGLGDKKKQWSVGHYSHSSSHNISTTDRRRK